MITPSIVSVTNHVVNNAQVFLKSCRECQHQINEQAFACPVCGAPYPAKHEWDGWGFEYKSHGEVFGLPLLHISFKYRFNKVPVPAKGVIAIGQFAAGIVTIFQFGVGVFSLSQFTLAGFAVAQFAVAWSLLAQFGLYVDQGYGKFVINLREWMGL